MNIFMTGITGFLGQNVLAFFIRHVAEEPGSDIRLNCLVRSPEKANQLLRTFQTQLDEVSRAGKKLSLHLVQGDLLSPETYRDVAREADVVLHLASLVSLKDGPEFYTQNTETTRQLIQTLQGSEKLQRVVMVSSIAAVDRPLDQLATLPLTEETPPHPNTDYGKSKLQAEELLVASGLPYTILRPAYIFGSYPRPKSSVDRFIRDLVSGQPYTKIPFPGRVSLIYALDLADLIWQSAHHPKTLNQRYFAAYREPIKVSQAFAQTAQLLGRPFALRPVRDLERLRAWVYARYPQGSVHLLCRILFEDYFYCASDKIYRDLNYQPRYGLLQGMKETLAWYQQRADFSLK